MKILTTLLDKARSKNVSFLLCGGHALNAYGVSRQTGDVDLIIRHDNRDVWKEILSELRYSLYHEHPNFLQYKPPDVGAWPIDLILVQSDTFDGLSKDSIEKAFGDAVCKIPSVQHLIAMKLHALKENFENRELTDISDIIKLLRVSNLRASDSWFRQLCKKYATVDIYEQIVRRER